MNYRQLKIVRAWEMIFDESASGISYAILRDQLQKKLGEETAWALIEMQSGENAMYTRAEWNRKAKWDKDLRTASFNEWAKVCEGKDRTVLNIRECQSNFS